jgi:hypothetical protein
MTVDNPTGGVKRRKVPNCALGRQREESLLKDVNSNSFLFNIGGVHLVLNFEGSGRESNLAPLL